MEPMIVEVHEVQPVPHSQLWVGTVLATSREQVAGSPRVTLTLHVRFLAGSDEPPPEGKRLRQMARDEALRFLDIA